MYLSHSRVSVGVEKDRRQVSHICRGLTLLAAEQKEESAVEEEALRTQRPVPQREETHIAVDHIVVEPACVMVEALELLRR